MKQGNYTSVKSSAYRKSPNLYIRFSNCPCNGCQSRHVGCHSGCEKYQEEKLKYEEKKKMINEGRRKNSCAYFRPYTY